MVVYYVVVQWDCVVSAIGCSDYPTPPGAWVARAAPGGPPMEALETERALVRCNATGEEWTVVCRGGRWDGPTHNCTDSQFNVYRFCNNWVK